MRHSVTVKGSGVAGCPRRVASDGEIEPEMSLDKILWHAAAVKVHGPNIEKLPYAATQGYRQP